MSEPEYPEAWGVLHGIANTDYREWGYELFDGPQSNMRTGETCVRLIPRPTVDRLIAEAEQRGRDAERERCRTEITRWMETVGKFRFDEPAMRDRQIGIIAALRDAVVIASGTEPGEG